MEEEMMMMMRKKETCMYNSSAALAMRKDSHKISKVKPKIRIIHIFAPEIIKTDVANFRELVQRLTGKPTTTTTSAAADKICKLPREEEVEMKKMEQQLRTGFRGIDSRERIKEEEEEIWRGTADINSGGGFLSGFADLDGFMMQELGGEFPLLACEPSHLMHLFGETQLLS